jgi:4-amino-4-deoxy-L-arabinose transferase-like glycosyltransferase
MVNLVAAVAFPFSLLFPFAATDLPLIGRATAAVVGALSIYPMAFIVLRLGWSTRAAVLIAPFLLAVAPMHVSLSRHLKEDVFLTAGILISLLATFPLLDRPDCRRRVMVAGAGAAVACAAKFVGALMLLPILFLILSSKSVRKLALTAIAVGSFAAAFIILSPQVLLVARALADINDEVQRTVLSQSTLTLHFWQWPDWGTYFFRTAVVSGLTLTIAATGLLGLGRALPKDRRTSAIMLLAVVLCLWYILIELSSAKRSSNRSRYALPVVLLLIPFAAPILSDFLARRRYWLTGFLIAALLTPTVRTIRQTAAMHTDTRERAAAHLAANPPALGVVGILSDFFVPPSVLPGDYRLIELHGEPSSILSGVDGLDTIVIDSILAERLDNFPHLSPHERSNLLLLRESFPQATLIDVPPHLRHSIHQPTFEIRTRQLPVPP